MPKRKKTLSKSIETQGGKNLPRQSSATPDQMFPQWSFELLDIGGIWCIKNISPEHLSDLMGRLKNLETMAWAEIKQSTGSHHVEKEQLIKPAQNRLIEIGQDDIDELFSLRITGERRLWGILQNHILQILWWDPHHAVCPSHLKHT
jgi:hypothetical protein